MESGKEKKAQDTAAEAAAAGSSGETAARQDVDMKTGKTIIVPVAVPGVGASL